MVMRKPAEDEPGWTDLSARPDAYLGYTVVRLGHVLARQFAEALAEHGLTASGFGVLAHLARDPGLGSGQLARLVLITPQSMGVLLNDLEREGLVSRRAARRGQRRTTEVTDAGQARLAAAAPAILRLDQQAREVLGAAEAEEVNVALLRLLAAVVGGGR
jgi:DNA-binding MarR family transcriptional regulator